MALKPGDVLTLGIPVESPIGVDVGDTPEIRVRPGTQDASASAWTVVSKPGSARGVR